MNSCSVTPIAHYPINAFVNNLKLGFYYLVNLPVRIRDISPSKLEPISIVCWNSLPWNFHDIPSRLSSSKQPKLF